jgi:DNA uptake protein ComE-like DNA-binding protein
MAAVMATLMALPAAAQTFSTNPTTPGDPSIGVHQAQAAARASRDGLVDINTASPSALDTLPGIGKTRSDAIVRNRPYRSKDDLVSRHIIPQSVYNEIRDKIVARQG